MFDEEINVPSVGFEPEETEVKEKILVLSPEKIEDAPTESDKLAKEWGKRIERARKHYDKFFKRCEHNRKLVAGFDWEKKADESDFVAHRANLILAAIAGTLPNLYAKNPEISILPVRKTDQSSHRLDKFNETLETVLNRYLENAHLKQRGRSIVRSALTCSYGVAKIVYQRDLDADPMIQTRILDAQDNLMKIDGLLSTVISDEDRRDLEAKKQELEETLKGYTEDTEAEKLEGLVIDAIRTDQILVDPAIDCVEDYESASWIAQVIPMKRDAVEQRFKVRVPKATTYKEGASTNEYSGNAEAKADDLVAVLEIWDADSQRVYTMCEGCDYFLREPYSPQKVGSRWYPFFILPFNIVDGTFFAPSLVDLMEKLQDEHNEIRDTQDQHRKLCKPAYIATADIDRKSIESFEQAELGEIILFRDADGRAPNQVITPKQYPPMDGAIYDTSAIRQDIEMVTGLQDAMRSSVVKAKTATEAQIMQQGLSSRVAAFRDCVEDWLQDIATYSAQIILNEVDEEGVQEIMGQPYPVMGTDPMGNPIVVGMEKPYDWAIMSKDEIAKMVKIRIVAGSTGSPNKMQEQENWTNLLPTLGQLVQQMYQLKQQGIDTKPVEVLIRETLRRTDDRLDPDSLIPDIQPPAMPMPEQQQPM